MFAGKRWEVINGHPINARRAFVRLHLFPGEVQIRTVKHLPEQRVRIDWSRSMLPSMLSWGCTWPSGRNGQLPRHGVERLMASPPCGQPCGCLSALRSGSSLVWSFIG
jgi:hypothetical protein